MYDRRARSGRPATREKQGALSVAAADVLTRAPDKVMDQALAVALDDMPASVPHYSEIEDFLRTAVASEFSRRRVAAEDLCRPRVDVMVPAVEALRYSQNRQPFAALIAATMDTRTRDAVLPAYVEILKQLSQDELQLIKALPPLGRHTPIADLVYVHPNGQVTTAARNVLLPEFASRCALPRNLAQYVDNLVRLNLIARPLDQQAADVAYRPIAQRAFVKRIMKAAPDKARGGVDKAVCGLTDLGDAFRRICLGDIAIAAGKR